ncbi:MAG TPA: metallopeptidase family protein [Polyangia bacterium]|nr:metallopeptidase family protein [Polyangia bacterium]
MADETDHEDEGAELDPRIEAAWQALEAGEVAEARRRAEALEPGSPEALLLAAACFREEGEAEQAIATLRRAIAADPEWATPELWLGEILAGDPEAAEEALAHAERALDLAEEEDEFLAAATLKATLEVELGETDAARETLAELPPPDVRLEDLELALEIADLHLAVGEPETARARLRVLCEANPDSADAWHALGCAAEDLGDEAERRSAWKRTWSLDAAPGAAERLGGDRLPEAEVAAVADAALEELPPRARELLAGIPMVIAELPAEADVEAGLDPRALGLFSGTAHGDGGAGLGGQPGLTQILLFRRNLERMAVDEDDLREEIRTTLLHETGHFFGLSDAALDELGLG